MASLTDIYKQERKVGKGLSSALSKRMMEKIDPRQMFDQSGLLVAMFPSLKAYTAKRENIEKTKTSNKTGAPVDTTSKGVLAVSTMTAKNTMVLPAMARDMNLMRQNMAKMVKLQGGTPAMKSDMFFKRAGERNTLFQSALGKIVGDKNSSMGKISGLMGLLGGGGERDGQSPETAFYVTGGGAGGGFGDIDLDRSRGGKRGVPSWLQNGLKIGGRVAGVAGAAYSAYELANAMVERDRQSATAAPEIPTTPAAEATRGAGINEGLAKDIVDVAIKERMTRTQADAFAKEVSGGKLGILDCLNMVDKNLSRKYLEMSADRTITGIPTKPVSPPSEAGGGRGFINPEFVKGGDEVPENVITDAQGAPIKTGTGGYAVSPSYETPAPIPVTPTVDNSYNEAENARNRRYNRPPTPATSTATPPSAVTTPAPSASPVPVTDNYIKLAAKLIRKEEGLPKGGYAYVDSHGHSIGYGHLITEAEKKQGFINLGDETVKIDSANILKTKMTPDQAEKLLAIDLPKYERQAKTPLGDEAWNKLNDAQKAVMISSAYNTGQGGIAHLVSKGLKEAILSGDMQKAGDIITKEGYKKSTNAKTGQVEVNPVLVKRRAQEGAMLSSGTVEVNDASRNTRSGQIGQTVINNVNNSSSPQNKSSPDTSVYDGGLWRNMLNRTTN